MKIVTGYFENGSLNSSCFYQFYEERIFSILIIGVLLGSAIVVQLNVLPEADALKSKGTPTSQYGSSTKDKVCGDRLCSEIPKEPVILQKKRKRVKIVSMKIKIMTTINYNYHQLM